MIIITEVNLEDEDAVSVKSFLDNLDKARKGIVDYFDPPVGTLEERAADYTDWPGFWIDATGFMTHYFLGYHTGSDLNLNHPHWDSDRGKPVFSAAHGIVTCAEKLRGSWGKVVVMRHKMPDGSDICTRYAHLATIDIEKGQFITRGTRIGTIGRPPPSGAYHLHYDVSPGIILIARPGLWPGKNRGMVAANFVDPLLFTQENR